MPEVRRDPVLGEPIIIAPERFHRPMDHPATEPGRADNIADSGPRDCPFCQGNEALTPGARLLLTSQDEIVETPIALDGTDCMDTASVLDDWTIRVIPNRYPALSDGPQLLAGTAVNSGSEVGIRFTAESSQGIHEVVIESPHHATRLDQLSRLQFRRILRVWQRRMQTLLDHGMDTVNVFRNSGVGSGASVSHVHSQIIATPFVPPLLDRELTAGARHFAAHGATIWEQLTASERRAIVRVVSVTDSFTTFCPFASRFPGEMWVVPSEAAPGFEHVPSDQLDEAADVLRDAVLKLNAVFPQCPFNIILRSAPQRDFRRESMCWHLRILPRMMGIAGFEIGSGTWINVLSPEDAAARLRDASAS